MGKKKLTVLRGKKKTRAKTKVVDKIIKESGN